MTDDKGRERRELNPHLRIMVDGLGDPFVQMDFSTGTDAGLSPEQTEQLALKMIAAAGAARARASVIRNQLLLGVPLDRATSFADGLLNY